MIFGKGPSEEIIVLQAEDRDIPEIADLHGQSFSRGWSTAELIALHEKRGMTFVVARKVGKPNESICGFNIVRKTEFEAEVISIAVRADMRSREIGLALMRDAINRLHADRIPSLFLEVDENNESALRLYKRLGFDVVGQRPSYYRESPSKPDVNNNEDTKSAKPVSTALVMRLDLV